MICKLPIAMAARTGATSLDGQDGRAPITAMRPPVSQTNSFVNYQALTHVMGAPKSATTPSLACASTDLARVVPRTAEHPPLPLPMLVIRAQKTAFTLVITFAPKAFAPRVEFSAKSQPVAAAPRIATTPTQAFASMGFALAHMCSNAILSIKVCAMGVPRGVTILLRNDALRVRIAEVATWHATDRMPMALPENRRVTVRLKDHACM